MTESTFTLRVEDDLKTAFAMAARDNDRTGAQLIRDFMRDYVRNQRQSADHDTWFREQVEIGRASANAGHLIPNNEIEAEFAARRAASLRKANGSAG